MPNLTAKELGALEDQLSAEQLLIKKYIYGTNRQVVRKYLKKQAHRKGQK